MHLKKKQGLTVLAAVAMALGSASAGAAGWKLTNASPTVPVAGGSVTLEVVYESDGATTATQTDIVLDTSKVTFVSAAAHSSAPTSLCSLVSGNTLRSQENLPSNAVIPTGTKCTYVLTANAGADGDTMPLAFSNELFIDAGGNDTSSGNTSVGGSLIWQAAPPDVVLGFAPASAVAFPGGTSGTSTTASIAVSVATGSIGTGTVSNCVVGGTNASAFSVTSALPLTVPPAGNIDLSVTLANGTLSATLTCDVADAGTAPTHTWNLTAPAGTPVPAPGYSSNPAPGAAIDRTGIPGSSCNSSVVITNNGFAGAGSDLTYNCSVAGADFTIASGASGTVAVGSSATVSVAVACPADGTSVTDTLTCTSNDPAVSTATYALSANGQAFVAPTFVPASSLWSKLALFGIFAALGMLVLGLRRNH